MHELLEGLTIRGIFCYSNSGALRRWLSDWGWEGANGRGTLASLQDKAGLPECQKVKRQPLALQFATGAHPAVLTCIHTDRTHGHAHGTRACTRHVGTCGGRCPQAMHREHCVQLGSVSSWSPAVRLLRRRQVWPSRPLGREGDRPLLPRKDADPWTLVPTEPSGVETVVGTHFAEGLEVGSGGEETSLYFQRLCLVFLAGAGALGSNLDEPDTG